MMLDDELDTALEERASHEGVSKAELLREYARQRLIGKALTAQDPLWGLVGRESQTEDIADLPGPVSEHVGEALYGS